MKKKILFNAIITVVILWSCLFLSGCEKGTFTITFQSNCDATVQSEYTGKLAKAPELQFAGHHLEGWYTNENFYGEKVNFPYYPRNDVTLYAKWGRSYTDESDLLTEKKLKDAAEILTMMWDTHRYSDGTLAKLKFCYISTDLPENLIDKGVIGYIKIIDSKDDDSNLPIAVGFESIEAAKFHFDVEGEGYIFKNQQIEQFYFPGITLYSIYSIKEVFFNDVKRVGKMWIADGDHLIAIDRGHVNFTVPKEIKSFALTVFMNCYETLTKITFEENSQFVELDTPSFVILIKLKEIVLVEGLEIINNLKFHEFHPLRKVFIPLSVTTIGNETFAYQDNLIIYCAAESKPPGWDDGWCDPNITVVWGYNGEK